MWDNPSCMELDAKASHRLSQRMSYALRFATKEYGVVLGIDGTVPIEKVTEAINRKHKVKYSPSDVIAIGLAEPEHFEVIGDRIRANVSMPKSVTDPEPIEPPEKLYLGIRRAELKEIIGNGLKPNFLGFVRLFRTKEAASKPLSYKGVVPTFLVIAAHDAWKNGIEFFRQSENVFLSKPIKPEYISVAIYHRGIIPILQFAG